MHDACGVGRGVGRAFGVGVELDLAGHDPVRKGIGPGMKPGASTPNRFYMYGVIARLAMLSASYELETTDPDAEVYE